MLTGFASMLVKHGAFAMSQRLPRMDDTSILYQDSAMPAKHPLIESDPKVMAGKPVVAGTRIAVELILEKLAAGESIDQVLEAHPRLTREGISAALAFAADALRADVVYPPKSAAE